MDQTKTGGLIRALRTQKGLTQKALAEAIGVGDKAVSKWERAWGAPMCPSFRNYHRFWASGWRLCSPVRWTPTTRKEEI